VANVVRDVVSTLTGGALRVAGLVSTVVCLGGSLQILVWSLLTLLQPIVYQATLVICMASGKVLRLADLLDGLI